MHVQPDELNLLEDGLHLWLIALRNAPQPQQELLELFPNLLAAMEKSTGMYLRQPLLCPVMQGYLYGKAHAQAADSPHRMMKMLAAAVAMTLEGI